MAGIVGRQGAVGRPGLQPTFGTAQVGGGALAIGGSGGD